MHISMVEPPYQGLVKAAEEGFDTGFDKIELAAGKAPDMSHLDAGVCPFMEKAVNEKGAETEQEIRAAVKKA